MRERAKRDNGRFQTATDPSCVRPMLEVAWPAMLAVFSMSFEVSEAPATVETALAGFSRMIHLTCVTGMSEVRDAFVLPLANLTSLHSPGALRGKNVVAMRELLKVAMDNANTLGSAWTHCLKAVSRFDRLYNYAMGFDDVSLFTDDANDGNDGSQAEGSHKKGGSGRLFRKSVKAFGSPAGGVHKAGGTPNKAPHSSSSSSGGTLSMMPSFMMPTSSMSGMFGGGGGGGDESPFAHLKKRRRPTSRSPRMRTRLQMPRRTPPPPRTFDETATFDDTRGQVPFTRPGVRTPAEGDLKRAHPGRVQRGLREHRPARLRGCHRLRPRSVRSGEGGTERAFPARVLARQARGDRRDEHEHPAADHMEQDVVRARGLFRRGWVPPESAHRAVRGGFA